MKGKIAPMKGTPKKAAVIVVDVQRDFTELAAGSLAVPETDLAFIEKVRQGSRVLKEAGLPVFATQDWHPADHVSFYTRHEGKKPLDVVSVRGHQQVLWPPHCVQGSRGAEVLLDEDLFEASVKTGSDPDFESYSGFQDDGGHKTSLHALLQKKGIGRLVIYGIATDFCVMATALDAIDLGYEVFLIRSLCRGVDPKTTRTALEEMTRRGIAVREDIDLREITK